MHDHDGRKGECELILRDEMKVAYELIMHGGTKGKFNIA